MKQKLLFFAVLCSIGINMEAQTTIPILALPEGNNTGDGTFLGVQSYSTQPVGSKSFALEHHFYGAINSSINFFRGGSINGGFLTFNTSDNTERMRIDALGNVGIGTTNPQAKLDVIGDIKASGLVAATTGISIQYDHGFLNNIYNGDNYMAIQALRGLPLSINPLGNNVGIGTTTPDQKLTVKGKIHAEEVIVDLNVPVADYVFAKDYDLMPLHKVEQYVQQNSHLPDIPSASEIKEQGLSMGEMQNKLLKKIEELTLYAIEQNKKIAQQNIHMEKMEQRIKELEKK